jgi:hypothetical protein
MVNSTRGFALVVGLAAWLTAGVSYGQDTLPPSPVPVMPPGARVDGPSQAAPPTSIAVPAPYPPVVPTTPPVLIAPPPPPTRYPPPPPPPGTPVFPGGEYHPPCSESGLYFAVEADLLVPHVKNRLFGTVMFPDGSTDVVHVPQPELDWTLSPRFELGYRLEDDLGALVFSYRFIESEGSGTIQNFDTAGDGDLHSRLDVQVVDLDYMSHAWTAGSSLDMHWKAGVRLGSVYFDSAAIGEVAAVRTTNHFFGVGPHVGLDTWYQLGQGFALFSRLEGAAMVGRIHQTFDENFILDDGSVLDAGASSSRTRAVPVLNAQLGVGWSPRIGADRWRFSFGYQYEHWWTLGDTDTSRAELTDQGVFFRGEFNF